MGMAAGKRAEPLTARGEERFRAQSASAACAFGGITGISLVYDRFPDLGAHALSTSLS